MKKELRQEIELKLYRYSEAKDTSWNRIIADYVKTMPKQQQQLMCMRYVEKKTEKQICEGLHIERSTYYSWINTMLNDLAIAAAYERLIEP
ncbi:MAG: DUF1492 domain-containing protein [Lachnospiraceae bacterium]